MELFCCWFWYGRTPHIRPYHNRLLGISNFVKLVLNSQRNSRQLMPWQELESQLSLPYTAGCFELMLAHDVVGFGSQQTLSRLCRGRGLNCYRTLASAWRGGSLDRNKTLASLCLGGALVRNSTFASLCRRGGLVRDTSLSSLCCGAALNRNTTLASFCCGWGLNCDR